MFYVRCNSFVVEWLSLTPPVFSIKWSIAILRLRSRVSRLPAPPWRHSTDWGRYISRCRRQQKHPWALSHRLKLHTRRGCRYVPDVGRGKRFSADSHENRRQYGLAKECQKWHFDRLSAVRIREPAAKIGCSTKRSVGIGSKTLELSVQDVCTTTYTRKVR